MFVFVYMYVFGLNGDCEKWLKLILVCVYLIFECFLYFCCSGMIEDLIRVCIIIVCYINMCIDFWC